MYFRLIILMFGMAVLLSETSVAVMLSKLMRNYNPEEHPHNGHFPVHNKIGIYVTSLKIDTYNMEYTMSMYLRQNWRDPRLSFNPDNRINVPPSKMRNIWQPDLFFRNGMAKTPGIMANSLMSVNSSGFVWSVKSIGLRRSCPMRLQNFPFDVQTCPVIFESYSNTMDRLYFTWLDKPFEMDKDMSLGEFTYRDSVLNDCSQNTTVGAFPCLEINLVLRRNSGPYIKLYFLPTALLVAISWISFWMPVDAARGRLLLLIPLMLVMFSPLQLLMITIPRLPYNTALEVWITLCMVMIAGALAEFCIVHLITKKSYDVIEDADETTKRELEMVRLSKKYGNKGETVDKCCRGIFPALFAILVMIYCLLYTRN